MAEYRSTLLIVLWLTILGFFPCPSKATPVLSLPEAKARKQMAPISAEGRSLPWENPLGKPQLASPKLISDSSFIEELGQNSDSKAKDDRKKRNSNSNVPKPVRGVLHALRGRKTLLLLSLVSVFIAATAVFLLLKLFDNSTLEEDEEDFPPNEMTPEEVSQKAIAPKAKKHSRKQEQQEEEDSDFHPNLPAADSQLASGNFTPANIEEVNGGKTETFFPEKRSPVFSQQYEAAPETEKQVSAATGESLYPPPVFAPHEAKRLKQIENQEFIDFPIAPEESGEDRLRKSQVNNLQAVPRALPSAVETESWEENSHITEDKEAEVEDNEDNVEGDRFLYEDSYRQQESVDGVSVRDREFIDPHSAELKLDREASPAPVVVDEVKQLIEGLENADPERRHRAIWELGQKGDSRAVQPLVNLLTDSDSKEQSLILGSLSEIGGKTLKPMSRALKLSLQNDNPEVRKNAIRDLTSIYEVAIEISNILQLAVDDPDPEVEETAKWALNQLNRIRPSR